MGRVRVFPLSVAHRGWAVPLRYYIPQRARYAISL